MTIPAMAPPESFLEPPEALAAGVVVGVVEAVDDDSTDEDGRVIDFVILGRTTPAQTDSAWEL